MQSFQTYMLGQTVQTQISCSSRSSLIRVFTVCHSIYIFWSKNPLVWPFCLNFRMITAKFSSVRKFRNFKVSPFFLAIYSLHIPEIRLMQPPELRYKKDTKVTLTFSNPATYIMKFQLIQAEGKEGESVTAKVTLLFSSLIAVVCQSVSQSVCMCVHTFKHEYL